MTEPESSRPSFPPAVVQGDDDSAGGDGSAAAPVVPDFIARAIRAQGKVAIEEVAEKMALVDLDEPLVPPPVPPEVQEELFEPACAVCRDMGSVYNFETHREESCPNPECHA